MPYTPFNAISPKVTPLLERLQGMTLRSAQIVENGFAFIYEDSQQRLLLRILPSVYTQGKNIVDPINDMTLLVELRSLPIEGESAGELIGSVEMGYSTWFGEDFL